MIRSGFKSKPVAHLERADRSAEFASWTPRERKAARCSAELSAALEGIAKIELQPVTPKTPNRKRQAIRDSAKGEECLVRIPGVCRGGTEHTIWSHAPLGAAGKGRGVKSLDLAGAYCCTACDSCADGQSKRPNGMTRTDVLLAWHEGHMRSLVRLAQKGLV